jgi:hypothetical protein
MKGLKIEKARSGVGKGGRGEEGEERRERRGGRRGGVSMTYLMNNKHELNIQGSRKRKILFAQLEPLEVSRTCVLQK